MVKLELLLGCLRHILQLIDVNQNGVIINQELWDVHFPGLKNATWMTWSADDILYEELVESLDTLVFVAKNDDIFHEYFEYCDIDSIPLKGSGVLIAALASGREIRDVFREIWGCRIANAFLVTENLKVYTYSPVSECSLDVVSLGQCKDIKVISKQGTKKGFNNCTLDVSVSTNRLFTNGYENSYNLEGGLLQILASKLDFNINLTCPQCDNSDIIVFAPTENFDVAAGGLPFSPKLKLSMAYYQSQNEYSFFLPVASPIPHWKIVFYIFDRLTWIGIVATSTFLVAISYLDFGRLDLAIAHVLSLLLTNSCLKARKLQFLFVLWSTAALLFTRSYSGLLTSFMCKSIPDQVSTFEDIVAHEYFWEGSIYDISSAFQALFNHKHFAKMYVPCTIDSWNCYEGLKKGNNAYFTSTHKIMYQMSYNRTHRWHRSPTIQTTYMAFVLRRSSPYVDSMQQYLTYIAECGILSKLDEYNWKPRQDEGVSFQILKLNQIYFAFFLYVICTVAASVVLLVEKSLAMFA